MLTDIDSIASALTSTERRTHPIRVGIDGFCASGKTTIADALAKRVRAAGRTPIRVSADDFQNPPETRWQLGSQSPEGFRRFQIDFEALRSNLLEPLGPNGSRKFRTTWYDVHRSTPHISAEHNAAAADVLLLDGLFLHSNALRGCFEFTVFVSADFETCLERALKRNQERASCLEALAELYRTKYIPAFAQYLNEACPERRASFVVRT